MTIKKRANFLGLMNDSMINYEKVYEVMLDFHKGGLTKKIYEEFIKTTKLLPPHNKREETDFVLFEKFNLSDVSDEEFATILREVMRRGVQESKMCWHPNASNTTCNLDSSGKIIVSGAHSIQNNRILSEIAENGHVMTYALDKGKLAFDNIQFGRKHASVFFGFCNSHDALFRPIEINSYSGTEEQFFLFAYRGFVVSLHKKTERATWMNYGEQSTNDIVETKKIFDASILSNNFSVLNTEVFELPSFYPIAASSAFYLDFDFEGNPIPHTENRAEYIFVTLIPTGNKTYFLLSYFHQDGHLYKKLGEQLRNRNNLKSDITMIIAGHTDNVYFNPTYYMTFIEKHENVLMNIIMHTQTKYFRTPSNYLDNPYGINFFGY
jgi:hypothetical protein